ncbi:MAG: hypothetical protein ACOYL6_03180 [Bacteriovoracaceae bacterium]
MKKLLIGLLAFGSISSYAVTPETQIKDLKISLFAGGEFGASGFGGNIISFQETVGITANVEKRYITVHEGNVCKIISKSDDENHSYDKGHGYGINSIKYEDDELRIFSTNDYYTPDTMWIICPGLTEKNTVKELEDALKNVIKVK